MISVYEKSAILETNRCVSSWNDHQRQMFSTCRYPLPFPHPTTPASQWSNNHHATRRGHA